MTQSAPFGSWTSPITAQLISAGATGITGLASNGEHLFWLEQRPTEGGRSVLLRYQADQSIELTPGPYNVRSRVHEYGGGSFCVTDSHAYFVNFTDQNLYQVSLTTGAIEQITETPNTVRYADMAVLPGGRALVAVCETHGSTEPINSLVRIDLDSGAVATIRSGHDFYSNPRLSPDGERLCFVSWDHPNMPWDGSQLHLADLAGDQLANETVIAGGADESIVQPTWTGSDRLVFASDRGGWWNLFSYDPSGLYCIHEDHAEYGHPPWSFGMRSFALLDDQHLVCRRIEDGISELSILGLDNGLLSPLSSDWCEFAALTAHRGCVYFIGGAPDHPSAIVEHDPGAAERTLVESGSLGIDPDWFSAPEAVAYPTRDGATGHGYFYPPKNPDQQSTGGARPPVLVITHGGPTGMTTQALNLRAQYYTSRGWAVFDVNYGGSTGYGKAYRQRLDGQWGIVDVQDCEDGIAHLAGNGLIDPDRAAIRGGSAGGFTTLAALTLGDRFAAGASHYGIGDLEALARDTHKFESRYLERLVGPYPEERQRYVDRSPLHHVDQLSCPVVFFQGLDDPVVPPNQAEAMVQSLRDQGLPVAYIAFPGEQHGFRKAENIERAIEAEYLFFARVFGIEPADEIPALEIMNL